MKLHILIGAPGSGKSTWADNQSENSLVFSSDEYRDILEPHYPDLDSKELNKVVFDTLHKDLFGDIEIYGDSYEYIYDATNLNRRRRRFLYKEMKRKFKDIEIVAHVFFKSLQQLYDINKVRPERTLPEDVIEKYYFNIQIPRLEVDCDSMEGHGEQFGKSEAFKLEIKSITDGTLQHDCPPHHMESVKDHIEMCMHNSNNSAQEFISYHHDLGKAVTKKIGSDGRARYIGHANVSAYYCLSYCLLSGNVDLKAGLMCCEIIYQHMVSHQGMGVKNIRNNKLDDELLYYLAEFAAIDSKSRITAYEEGDYNG